MNRYKALYPLLGLLSIPLLLVSCSGTPTPQPVPTSTLVITPTIEETGDVRPEMPAYAKPGPYTVGMTALNIPNDDYVVDAYVWYPVQANGTPDVKDGPYGLVVYASGWGTPPLEMYNYLLKHLASYGFVTTTWRPRAEGLDETGNQWFAPLGYRPLDYKLLLEYLETMTARGGPLEAMIDMQRIAIAGHSMGGGTALEESGAQIDFSWCSAHRDLATKDQERTCAETRFVQKEIADIRGLEGIPEGEWPQINDPRIVAMIAMAPMGKVWGAEYDGVATVKIPAMIMVGDQDAVVRPELAAYPVYEHLGSQYKSLVVFEQKDHLVFWEGDYTTATVEDLDRIKHITTAFLLTELNNDREAAKALSPQNMTFPGVRFETTEFNK